MKDKGRENKRFVKDPNVVKKDFDGFSFQLHLKSSIKYPTTTAAMEKVAKAETRADTDRRNGINDYTLPCEEVLFALDTFIREHTHKRRTGSKKNFDLSSSSEFTLYVLWELRHVLTHGGGIVDEKCVSRIDTIMRENNRNYESLAIDLSNGIQVGMQLYFDYDSYLQIKECLLSYISMRIPLEDATILRSRSNITNVRIDKTHAIVHYDVGTLMT